MYEIKLVIKLMKHANFYGNGTSEFLKDYFRCKINKYKRILKIFKILFISLSSISFFYFNKNKLKKKKK